MTFVHAKDTYFSLASNDLSTYTNTSQLEVTADSHDVTTYGKDAHVFKGGLLNGTASAAGIYDNSTSAGPRKVILPLVGTNVTLVRRPEGTGSGLPVDTANVLVLKYSETNPVADMVAWAVDLQISDTITSTFQ